MSSDKATVTIPSQMLDSNQVWPVVYVNTSGPDLRGDDPSVISKVNDAVYQALEMVQPEGISGQSLIKIHTGEYKSDTKLRPEYTQSSARFLRDKGSSGVVCGDTTVAYTGPRGYKQNSHDDCGEYQKLAEHNGWSSDGRSGTDFVILDRPGTSISGVFEFSGEETLNELEGIGHYSDFYLAGGFDACDFAANNAHFTLHGLAGPAGCVKSVAMGCASLKGKHRMHQAFLPTFDEERCTLCGRCVKNCPEGALSIDKEHSTPVVDPDKCIGCGECVTICAVNKNAVTLNTEQISDWSRGEDTLHTRMTDYTLGMMEGKWDRMVHVLHLYTMTELCDCLDIKQKSMTERDPGFVISKNPFAADYIGTSMVARELEREGRKVDQPFMEMGEKIKSYVNERYGIIVDTPVKEIRL